MASRVVMVARYARGVSRTAPSRSVRVSRRNASWTISSASPMLPVIRGEAETRRQILLYSGLLYAVTQLPFCAGGFGVVYLLGSIGLGLLFLAGAYRLYRRADRRSALRLYLFSMLYLALLFGTMVLDVKL